MFGNLTYIIILPITFVSGFLLCYSLKRREIKKRNGSNKDVYDSNESYNSGSDWWLFGLALFAFAIVLSIYYWNFGGGKISGENEHWGQFADFVGGLMNPLLSLIVLWTLIKTLKLNSRTINEETNRVKRQNAFDFSMTFQSHEMIESRLKASELLKVKNRKYFDLRKIKKSNEEEYIHLANVLNAFRQLNVLKNNGLIDETLSKELFGSYYCHFRSHFIMIIEADETDSDDIEHRSDKGLLAQIKQLDTWMPHDYCD